MSATRVSDVVKHIIVVIVLMNAVTESNGANILLSSLPGEGSHFFGAVNIGKALVSRGHNVTFILGESHAHRAQNQALSELFQFIVFHQNVPKDVLQKRQSKYNNFAMRHGSMMDLIELMRDEGATDCRSLLDDHRTLQRLTSERFDMIVYDTTWPCAVLFSSKIGFVPYVALSMVPLPSTAATFAGTEHNPSYVPVLGLGLSNKMTFLQRVGNTVFYYFVHSVFRVYYYQKFNELVDVYSIYSPTGNIVGLYQNSTLWLVNSDFAVEYPCVLPPSVIPVGGLTTVPANPLPADLEKFIQSSGTSGVVVCTTGTFITSIPNDIVDMFASAFGRLPQKVIWQLSQPPSTPLPDNVKTMSWVPQNDLLGHPKVRALFFQGGNNGFYEALYHGVPMVILPIIGDQIDVATIAESAGIGIKLDISRVTADSIFRAVNDVITLDEYKNNIRKRSEIFRDRPLKPTERAAFWIEHAIKHGGDYFRLPLLEHGFIRNSLLDVFAFLLAIVVVIMLVFIVTCKFFTTRCRILFRGTKSKQE